MQIVRDIYIYTLSCPVSNEVRYVGKTIQVPKKRLNNHLSAARTNRYDAYCQRWIRSLLNKNLTPIMTIIETTHDVTRERYWIDYYRKNTSKLTNAKDGAFLDVHSKSFKTSCKKVYMFSLEGIVVNTFNSVIEFRNHYNCNERKIKQHFFMKDGLIPSHSPKLKDLVSEIKKLKKILGRPKAVIVTIDNIEYEFDNIKDAAIALDITYVRVTRELHNLNEKKCHFEVEFK